MTVKVVIIKKIKPQEEKTLEIERFFFSREGNRIYTQKQVNYGNTTGENSGVYYKFQKGLAIRINKMYNITVMIIKAKMLIERKITIGKGNRRMT